MKSLRILGWGALVWAAAAAGGRRAGAQDLDAAQANELYERSVKLLEEQKFAEAVAGFRRVYDSRASGELGPLAAYNIACAHALSGKKSLSLDWLEKAAARGYKDADAMEGDDDLKSLREEPRYGALVQKLHRSQHGGPPQGEVLSTLVLNGESYDIYAEEGGGPSEEETLAYEVCQGQEPAFLLFARSGRVTRVAEAQEGRTIALVAPEVAEGRRTVALPELLWEAYLASEWEKKGDALAGLANGSPSPEALGAYENGLLPLLDNGALRAKLGAPYLALMKDGSTPREMLASAASLLARQPEPKDVDAEEADFAVAQGCALFFLHCYPRAAAALGRVSTNTDARGLLEVLRILGADRWTFASRKTLAGAAVSFWKAEGAPDGPGLPVYRACAVAEGETFLRSFLLTRRKLGDGERWFLHVASGGGEQLLEAYGATEPREAQVEARIEAELRSRRPQDARGAQVAAGPLPPRPEGGDAGRVEVRWGSPRADRVELRRETLEAAVWLGADLPSPIVLKGLRPGTYAAFLRDARGRVLGRRELSVEPGGKALLDVDRF